MHVPKFGVGYMTIGCKKKKSEKKKKSFSAQIFLAFREYFMGKRHSRMTDLFLHIRNKVSGGERKKFKEQHQERFLGNKIISVKSVVKVFETSFLQLK